jgi:hypothetical protein
MKKTLKVWVQVYSKRYEFYTTPNILFKKPVKAEIREAKFWKSTIYPCTITYDDKKPL